jgi:hypothetical protein
MMAMIPALLDAARTPATIVNWAGDEVSSIEEWCAYLAKLTGQDLRFAPTAHTQCGISPIDSVPASTTRDPSSHLRNMPVMSSNDPDE